jgi:hypothetical protein
MFNEEIARIRKLGVPGVSFGTAYSQDKLMFSSYFKPSTS